MGYGTSTTSVAIHYTVKSYLEARNIYVSTHHSLYTPLATNAGVASHISNDRPVVYFGEFLPSFNPNSWYAHAVIAYGYNWSSLGGYRFIAHFGWNGYNDINVTAVIGSLYTFTP
ncbi:MAG: hypothetical protein LBI54_04090 [Lachnospiraceae bacterium]|nr:hypothetical protein [Lachnospiraceae bacterium]